MNVNKELPLVVIVGPTASGKTSLAVEIAHECGGEIICADSRTIYKYTDIGTAKPSKEDQTKVPHWGLDLVEPGEYFSAFDFKNYANKKIKEIRSRGRVPFLVGGTGLYIDSVVFDYKFNDKVDIEERDRLNKLTLEELHQYCNKYNIKLPENYKNKRYVIRNIERKGQSSFRRDSPILNTIIIGINVEKDVLRDRISDRAEQIFKSGAIDEARLLGKKYGWDNEAMKGNIYPLIRRYDLGEITFEVMKEKNRVLDWQLAKRQMTWLRRDKFINWMLVDEARVYLLNALVKNV